VRVGYLALFKIPVFEKSLVRAPFSLREKPDLVQLVFNTRAVMTKAVNETYFLILMTPI
jgi:hypothetical protein